jgi:hypothetical protein
MLDYFDWLEACGAFEDTDPDASDVANETKAVEACGAFEDEE